jgi:uncharacterized low-complexity protein
MKNLFSLSNASKALALVSVLSFTACNNGASTDTDKTKETVTSTTDPKSTPGTGGESSSVSATNASDPQKPTTSPETATTMSFEKEMHDFGSVKEGDKVTHVFKFKNTGDKPLIISDAKGSCGCTVPSYPKEPIAPGKSGEIKVEFNSAGKKGSETKYVTLNANTIPAETRLTIKANVIAKDVKTN